MRNHLKKTSENATILFHVQVSGRTVPAAIATSVKLKPCRLGVGRGKEARKPKLLVSHTFYLWLCPWIMPLPQWVLPLCVEPLLEILRAFLPPLQPAPPPPPPPSHQLFSQDKTLPGHKLAQHYDPVSSQVQCQNTAVSSILILLEEKKNLC